MSVRSWFAARLGRDVSRASAPVPVTTLASLYDYPNAERVQPNFDQFACYAYGGNATVFSVLNRRMNIFAEASLVWRRLRDKGLFTDESLAVFEEPWPDGSMGDLLSRMLQDADLAGNAYIRDAGGRLERLRPDWVTIISEVKHDASGNQVREVIGYVYDPSGDPEREMEFFTADEVAHWAPIPDPLANFRGMSWLTPVVREINADQRMSEFRDAFFSNAATPNVIIKYQQKIAPEKVKALSEAISAKHAGPANAFSTLILDEGADPMPVGADMGGSAFAALQSASETRIAAAAGVPPLVAGLSQGMQYSQPGEYQTAVRAFVDLTMRPLWRSACAVLAKLVVNPGNAQLWYDTRDVSALRPGEKDMADVTTQNAATLNQLIMAGFDPESAVAAVTSGDMTLLKHTGMLSVQMQHPGAQPDTPAIIPDGNEAAAPARATDRNQL